MCKLLEKEFRMFSHLKPIVQGMFVVAGFCSLTACVHSPIENEAKLPVIIAIGDMHGDYQAYESLMLSAGLMNAKGDWSGGNIIFVQTGDIPDRGPDTLRIIHSLQKLEKQAPRSGGEVIPLVGNHEAMNMVGNLKYTHPGEYAAFANENSEDIREHEYFDQKNKIETRYRNKNPELSFDAIREKWNERNPLGKIEHQSAWAPKGDVGVWVSENQIVAKVQGYLFAHGGFSQEYTAYTLEGINAAGTEALLAQNWGKDSILRDSLGPLWYRGNVRGRGDKSPVSQQDEIIKVLETYEATHVIVGHTRNEEGIRMSLGGRLIQIDTGASAHYGGVPSYLRIENGEIFAHTLESVTKLN